jgi:hypothetical protein
MACAGIRIHISVIQVQVHRFSKKKVKLSLEQAAEAHRPPFTPRNIPGTHFC